MAYTDILYEKKDGVAWITINRPEVRNAFRTQTVAELTDAFEDARWDPSIGVVVLTGAGDKAFCSGGDQKERGQGGYAPGATGSRPTDVGGEGRPGAEGAGATSRPFSRPMDVGGEGRSGAEGAGATSRPFSRPMDVGGEGRSGAEGAGATSRPFSRPMDVEALHSAIRHIPKPVIAMVNGFAIGGGHVLHVLCDLTIASENAVFGQTGPRVGSVDAGHGTGFLARVVGEKKAREIWYLCRQYTAQEALAMGLVNRVVRFQDLRAEVEKWCAELLEKSPTALALAKQSFNIDSEQRAGVAQFAHTALGLYYQTGEAMEGRNAFVEKRPVDFRKFRK